MNTTFSKPKWYLLFVLINLLFLQNNTAQSTPKANDNVLTIKVSGIKKVKGSLLVAVYKSAEDYENGLAYAIQKINVPVTDKKQVLEITGLDFGPYGIKMFQDINDDGALNKNFVGIPKEPYGFSNDAKATFSAPDFEETVFVFGAENKAISIVLNN